MRSQTYCDGCMILLYRLTVPCVGLMSITLCCPLADVMICGSLNCQRANRVGGVVSGAHFLIMGATNFNDLKTEHLDSTCDNVTM